ncbi:MAG: hypothetical protein KDB46_07830 [Solirubrobacterales bacterium]|nr:hypothetical protein [Solirubrobacterales bacterium]
MAEQQQTRLQERGEQDTYEQQEVEQRITPAQEASGGQPESGSGPAADTAAVAAGGPAASQGAGAIETGPAAPGAEARSTEPQPTTEQADAPPASDREPSASAEPAASPGGGAPPGVGVAAASTAERKESAFPALIVVLGAIVAVVGSLLTEAKLEFNGNEVDLADNTMVAAGYGIAVIAAAILGAAVAVWATAKKANSWLPILLGVVIFAIAVYAGTAGLDVTPSFAPAGLQVDGAGDPSTGIFAVGIGGLLMILGGIGLARARR